MQRIALDLDRAAVVTRYQQASSDAIEAADGGELNWRTGDTSRRPAGVFDDLLIRPAAAGQTRKGHRRAHDFQKSATGRAVGFRLFQVGELALHQGAEFRRASELFKAPPVGLSGIAAR